MLYTEINALIPFYDDYGRNCTCILFKDGTKEYETYSIKNYMNRLLYHFHLDPRAVKFWTSQVINTKLNTPIIIDDTLIYIPAKFRKAVGKQDGCFGYINYKQIKSITPNGVVFENDTLLPTLSAQSYITKKCTDAKLLAYAYNEYKKRCIFLKEIS